MFVCWQLHCGHTFVQDQFTIYTVCEYCSSYISLLDKAQVCKGKQQTALCCGVVCLWTKSSGYVHGWT